MDVHFLPNEIVNKIGTFLHLSEAINFSSTCRRFYGVFEKWGIWKNISIRIWEDVASSSTAENDSEHLLNNKQQLFSRLRDSNRKMLEIAKDRDGVLNIDPVEMDERKDRKYMRNKDISSVLMSSVCHSLPSDKMYLFLPGPFFLNFGFEIIVFSPNLHPPGYKRTTVFWKERLFSTGFNFGDDRSYKFLMEFGRKKEKCLNRTKHRYLMIRSTQLFSRECERQDDTRRITKLMSERLTVLALNGIFDKSKDLLRYTVLVLLKYFVFPSTIIEVEKCDLISAGKYGMKYFEDVNCSDGTFMNRNLNKNDDCEDIECRYEGIEWKKMPNNLYERFFRVSIDLSEEKYDYTGNCVYEETINKIDLNLRFVILRCSSGRGETEFWIELNKTRHEYSKIIDTEKKKEYEKKREEYDRYL